MDSGESFNSSKHSMRSSAFGKEEFMTSPTHKPSQLRAQSIIMLASELSPRDGDGRSSCSSERMARIVEQYRLMSNTKRMQGSFDSMSLSHSQGPTKQECSVRDSEADSRHSVAENQHCFGYSTNKKAPLHTNSRLEFNKSSNSDISARDSKQRYSEDGGSALKFNTQLQKPFNSPMLIASVASISASSPASGGMQDYHKYGQESADPRFSRQKNFHDFRSPLSFDIENQEAFDFPERDPYELKRPIDHY